MQSANPAQLFSLSNGNSQHREQIQVRIRASSQENSEDAIKMEQFSQEYEKNRKKIIAYFKNKRFSQEESEELAQDTFIIAFEKQYQFRAEASFKTWVFKIAFSVYTQKLKAKNTKMRQGKTESLEVISEPESEEENPLEELIENEEKDLLVSEIKKLPKKQGKCISLRLRGLTIGEIADIFEMDKTAVKSNIGHARRTLSKIFKK